MGMSDIISFRALSQSNIPRREKESIISQFGRAVLESNREERMRHTASTPMHQTAALVRGGGESLLLGGVLGAMHAAEGLDIKGQVPADLLLAAGAGAVAVAMGDSNFATDARNAAQVGLTTFGFRQGYALVAELKRKSGSGPVGGFAPLHLSSPFSGEADFGDDIGEDPIVKMAREF